ncbi:DUF2087 domain-containing protein [Deinococcus misasensis]|uniref:DUF2087 domain-containing protein n=1 Tax=Deinococcus misasensis TaxID=392413 RepID=UPI0006909C58|nr:DUF2087 domain-containing protein [Deinococcus misasensis]
MLQSIHIKSFLLLQQPQRHLILQALQDGPQTLPELASLMHNEQQALQHLDRLMGGGVVHHTENQYVLRPQVLADLQKAAQHPWFEESPAFFKLLDSTFTEQGTLKALPAQSQKKNLLLQHLARLFDPQTKYTEKAVNETLLGFVRDVFMVRRSLIDSGFLERTPSGSQYWRPHDAN